MARPGIEDKELTAFLSSGTNFKGDLTFEGTVRIDGRFEGNINSKDSLVIGENAVVDAEVHVGTIMISGRVSGNIAAKEAVEINSKAQVHGNIKLSGNKLVIHEGAVFSGGCEMGASDTLEEPPLRELREAPFIPEITKSDEK
ncbi:MAG: polymer-forming cytoskeletal protein [Candidatus Vecturithrix sp.]|jgi:cytoskeletal protein CcmA (bactofilin family)|nr:polymer-forming cytoskeletal protein [Candidatus Vecturithrix sp.]